MRTESTLSFKACLLDNPPILYSRTVEDEQYRMASSFKSKARMYKNIKLSMSRLQKETFCRRLIDGIGWNISVLLVATMEGGRRFKRAKKAAAYVGLSVQEYTSGC